MKILLFAKQNVSMLPSSGHSREYVYFPAVLKTESQTYNALQH
jgi:hypothetical protein